MSAASRADAPTKGKKRAEKTITCSFCDMSFKKLEHLQRHERTHTLDRPYACDSCGKTFARQDTLHRHARLHLRKDDDGSNPKSGKKRRASTASTPPPPKPSSDGSPPTSSSALPSTVAVPHPLPVVNPQGSPSFSPLGLSMSLPVVPPSFPGYTQPEYPSIDPSVVSFSRRFSDAGHGAALPTAFTGATSSGTTAFTGQVAGTGTSGAGPPPQRPALLGSRPRALTLAGLPESLGCFSLVNSPAPSEAGDSDDSSSEEEAEDDGDVKTDQSNGEGDLDALAWVDPFPPPESHYPSPAFSEYSPSSLRPDNNITDLQAILDNDPVPAAFHRPSPPSAAEPDFDFEAFAASIEGASPSKPTEAPPVIPSTLEELLGSAGPDLLVHQSNNVDAKRYPTPPSGTLAPASMNGGSEPSSALPTFEVSEATVKAAAASFDLQAQLTALTSAADAEQQAREAAATAALFGGFGMSLPSSSPSLPATAASALGLTFGLSTPTPSFFPPVSKYHPPPPPQRGLSLPISSAPTAPQPPTMPAPPSTSVASAAAPPTPQTPFASLGGTYTTAYPSLSLPVAGFDLPNSTSTTSPAAPHSASVSSAAASAATMSTATPATSNIVPFGATLAGQDIHALLTSAWENRTRTAASASPSGGGSLALANLTFPSGSLAMPPLKSPFPQPMKSSTPAFYIPS